MGKPLPHLDWDNRCRGFSAIGQLGFGLDPIHAGRQRLVGRSVERELLYQDGIRLSLAGCHVGADLKDALVRRVEQTEI
jgi:hypothetical protein